MKKKNKKSKLPIFLLLLGISSGFAYLTSNLSIFGSSILKGQKWDVHFENVQVSSEGVQIEKPQIINKTSVKYNITLNKPGEFVEFTVDAKNDGTVDAMISSFEEIKIYEGDSETPLDSIPDYLEYSVTYADYEDVPIAENHLLKSGDKVAYKVHVEYKKDITKDQLVTSQKELTAVLDVDYEQADDRAIAYNKHEVTESTLSKTKFKNFVSSNNPGEVVFVNTGVGDSENQKYVDISEEKDKSILAWMDGKTMYVSAKDPELYVKAPKDCSEFLVSNYYLKKIDVSKLDTSIVTNMNKMFYFAGYKATTFEIVGLSNWDTSNVTNMSYMFAYTGQSATTWNIGDLSGWDTSKVEDMSLMFFDIGRNVTTLEITGLNSWDTSSVTSMRAMFSFAGKDATTFQLNLSDWDVSNVTTMEAMFQTAGNTAETWTIGDISGWDTSGVTNMRAMFNKTGADATTWAIGDISGWDTSEVTDMEWMFLSAGTKANYSLNLSGWNVDKVTSYLKFNTDVTSKVTPPNWVN